MPIYTKSGDDGSTALSGGKRILKSDVRVKAYGAVDELTSYIGLLVAKTGKKNDIDLFTYIQKDLYCMMSYLAGADTNISSFPKQVSNFEKIIDSYETVLPKISRFVLPQGTELSVYIHITRTVCRRSERAVVEYASSLKHENQGLKKIISYLNRLSDLLFMLARAYNTKEVVLDLV